MPDVCPFTPPQSAAALKTYSKSNHFLTLQLGPPPPLAHISSSAFYFVSLPLFSALQDLLNTAARGPTENFSQSLSFSTENTSGSWRKSQSSPVQRLPASPVTCNFLPAIAPSPSHCPARGGLLPVPQQHAPDRILPSFHIQLPHLPQVFAQK